jgi:Holliday junction resolvase RusA-like endonuclease
VSEVVLTIPMEPPSSNHYKRYRVIGKHASWYLTAKAKGWHQAVAIIAAGQSAVGSKHEISYTVFQGTGSRGDVDNYAKCILDALVKAGVLKSDASVVDLHAYKRRDRENPRTEIRIKEVA